jgi:hypothetical protein
MGVSKGARTGNGDFRRPLLDRPRRDGAGGPVSLPCKAFSRHICASSAIILIF